MTNQPKDPAASNDPQELTDEGLELVVGGAPIGAATTTTTTTKRKVKVKEYDFDETEA